MILPILLVCISLTALVSHRGAARAFYNREVHRQTLLEVVVSQIDAGTFFAAIEQASAKSGCAIRIDRKALEAAAIDETTFCHLRLDRVTLGETLEVLCEQGTHLRLFWYWDGTTPVITTEQAFCDNQKVTRCFDVRDLRWVSESDPPQFKSILCLTGPTSNNSGGGGGTGQGLFGGPPPSTVGWTFGPLANHDPLILLITEKVAPDSWRDYGGTLGSLCMIDGRLYVEQSPANLQKVARFLDELRAPISCE